MEIAKQQWNSNAHKSKVAESLEGICCKNVKSINMPNNKMVVKSKK